MAELATTRENYEQMGCRMTTEHVQRLEQVEEALKQEVEIPNKFIIPGDTPDGATLDLARTIIRRAERMAVKLLHPRALHRSEIIAGSVARMMLRLRRSFISQDGSGLIGSLRM